MRKILYALVTSSILICCTYAADLPVSFESAAERERYNQLLEQLRCLVCQNQSLSDSHADLAQDLRTEVYNMMVAGEDNQAILDFMVERYGDFVLYKPPVKSSTWLLWFGPVLLLLIASTVVVRSARVRNATPTQLSDDDRARIQRLTELKHRERNP